MKILAGTTLLILGFLVGAGAQTPAEKDCPSISVHGPAGIVQAGETATYKVQIDTEGRELDLRYIWSVSAGEILGGQGTTSVDVRQPAQSITATVEVEGFPPGCVNKASESVPYCPPPQPVKVLDIQEGEPVGTADFNEVIQSLKENQMDQLFIQVGKKAGHPSEAIVRKEREVLAKLMDGGLESSRVTLVRVYAEKELIRLWRVPPGAQRPRCEECESLETIHKSQLCPSISVTGPAGVTQPGDPFTVSANISGDVPKYITYTWSVSSGRILEGQGTNKIKVSTEKWKDVKSTATVKLGGLPDDCPDTAEETVVTAVHWQTFLADEFVEFSKSQGIEKLSAINFEPVTKGPFSIYFVAGVTAEKTQDEIKAQAAEFKRYLVNEKKVPADRIFYFYRKSRDAKISVYMVPLGSEPPECEECEKIDLIANRRLQNSSRN